MNIYKVKFSHFAPKDSKEGLVTYLLAEDDKQVYDWIKSESSEFSMYNSWKDNEEDGKTFDIYDNNYNCVASENFKNHMLRLHGDLFDEDADVSDAYYGVTLYGWELVREGVYYTDVIQAKDSLGIQIVDVTK